MTTSQPRRVPARVDPISGRRPGSVAAKAHEGVAQPAERRQPRLEERRQQVAGLAVEAHGRAAALGEQGQRRGEVVAFGERAEQRMGIQQAEIGALPELRAGAVRGIADEQHRTVVPARQGDMAVGRAREVVGSGGVVDDARRPRATAPLRRGARPERSIGSLGGQRLDGQAPEHRHLPLPDRQQAHHHGRAVDALAQQAGRAQPGEIGHGRPDAAPGIERRAGAGHQSRAQGRVRAVGRRPRDRTGRGERPACRRPSPARHRRSPRR